MSLSPGVNTSSIEKTLFEMDGLPLFLNLFFLMTAAGLGACFSALFQANRYIADGTFDPKFESSYWIRFVLGLMAGMMLAEIIPLPHGEGGVGAPASVARPTLAMLGGVSAAVVYRILNRLIEAVESLVRGETREIVASREQALRAELSEKSAQAKIQLAASLMQLHNQVASNASHEEINKEIDRLVSKLTPDDPDEYV